MISVKINPLNALLIEPKSPDDSCSTFRRNEAGVCHVLSSSFCAGSRVSFALQRCIGQWGSALVDPPEESRVLLLLEKNANNGSKALHYPSIELIKPSTSSPSTSIKCRCIQFAPLPPVQARCRLLQGFRRERSLTEVDHHPEISLTTADGLDQGRPGGRRGKPQFSQPRPSNRDGRPANEGVRGRGTKFRGQRSVASIFGSYTAI